MNICDICRKTADMKEIGFTQMVLEDCGLGASRRQCDGNNKTPNC